MVAIVKVRLGLQYGTVREGRKTARNLRESMIATFYTDQGRYDAKR